MSKTILVEFNLQEDVTPEIFIRKFTGCLAQNGVIRIGEGITLADGMRIELIALDEIEFNPLGASKPIIILEPRFRIM